jgi:hypothetical protein
VYVCVLFSSQKHLLPIFDCVEKREAMPCALCRATMLSLRGKKYLERRKKAAAAESRIHGRKRIGEFQVFQFISSHLRSSNSIHLNMIFNEKFIHNNVPINV